MSKKKQDENLPVVGCFVFLAAIATIITAIVFLIRYGSAVQERNNDPTNWTLVSNTTVDAERIFMHRENDYSFLVRSNDELKTTRLRNDGCYSYNYDYKIFDDVPRLKKCYIVKKVYADPGENQHIVMEIHIHNGSDIEGGNWSGGKIHGTTTVIE